MLYGIEFYCDAFISGSTVHIYPTYEFTEDKRPGGEDSFSICMGDALVPYEYGGRLWYKDYTMSDWVADDDLVANKQYSKTFILEY